MIRSNRIICNWVSYGVIGCIPYGLGSALNRSISRSFVISHLATCLYFSIINGIYSSNIWKDTCIGHFPPSPLSPLYLVSGVSHLDDHSTSSIPIHLHSLTTPFAQRIPHLPFPSLTPPPPPTYPPIDPPSSIQNPSMNI